MITKQQALDAMEFHQGQCHVDHGPRGRKTEVIVRWRRNGSTKTWKSVLQAQRFRVPVKYGIRSYGYITENNAGEFHTEEDCPLKKEKSMIGICRCTHDASCPEHPADQGADRQREQHHAPEDHTETIEFGGTEYDVEWAGAVPGVGSVRAQVAKVGGGTVGRKYGGRWIVRLVNGQREILETSEIIVPDSLPVRHKGLARIALDFCEASGL